VSQNFLLNVAYVHWYPHIQAAFSSIHYDCQKKYISTDMYSEVFLYIIE
jgi:hypothetical protein